MERTEKIQVLLTSDELKAVQTKAVEWVQAGKGPLSLSDMLRTMALQIPVEQIPTSTKRRKKDSQ